MKKILTALGNENINLELKKDNYLEIIAEDIQYKEGILEILERNQNIDYIILNSLLPGTVTLKELIEKINYINNKIKIIIFIEREDEEITHFLFEKKIYKIIYNNEINIKELINIIKNEQLNNEELKEEIEQLKKIIINNKEKNKINNKIKNIFNLKNIIERNKNKTNNKINNKQNYELNNNEEYLLKNEGNNKIKNKSKNIFNLKLNKKIQNINNINNMNNKNNINNIKYNKENLFSNNKKVVAIVGPSGVGKSIISVNIAKANAYLSNKILIIDFDLINNSIHTILGMKKTPNNFQENNLDILSKTIQINKKIDLIVFNEILVNKLLSNNNIEKIKLIFNKLKNNYDFIIIDINSNNRLDVNKEIINYSDISLFVTDTNLLEINKSIKLLDKYINKLKININKFNILFNKYNSQSIDMKLLKNIFSEFNIIGYLNYSANYNKLVNKNNKINFMDKKLKNEYLKINMSIRNLDK